MTAAARRASDWPAGRIPTRVGESGANRWAHGEQLEPGLATEEILQNSGEKLETGESRSVSALWRGCH